MRKIAFSIDKTFWSPTLIPGPITIISTINKHGQINIAPISWLQMASFKPPLITLSCSASSRTARNILLTKEFVVNFVDTSLVQKAFNSINWHGAERIAKSGFSFGPASKVKPPLVVNCKAHLECKLYHFKRMGALLIIGEIVAASIWDKIASTSSRNTKYKLFNQAIFMENKLYASIAKVTCVH